MLTNFLVIGMLLSISGQAGPSKNQGDRAAPFRAPVATAGIVLSALGVIALSKAAYVQVARSAEVMGRGALVVQADGARRYQYNPRFQDVMNSIPMGSIYDRNGLPLATGDWAELEKHRAEYQQLGVDIDRACSRSEIRHYPFGGLTFASTCSGTCARASAGAPATLRSSSAILRAVFGAMTIGPRWSK
jgi:hypothetical protein